MATSVDRSVRPEISTAYARLEDKILERDQKAASDIFYDLVRAQVPLAELAGQIVRIHAPYTHVPYHQRLDDGVPRFVNNDHCLLSSRASLDLMPLMPPELAYLPYAQTIWYMPTGLDPWNQLLGKMPGHYVRLYEIKFEGKPPLPEVHWPDQEPLPDRGHVAGAAQHVADARAARRGHQRRIASSSACGTRRWTTRRSAPRCSPSSSSPDSSTCRTACCTTAPTPPATSPTVPAPPWRWRARWAGSTRTPSCTRACPTSRWGRAGTRPTRWAAS